MLRQLFHPRTRWGFGFFVIFTLAGIGAATAKLNASPRPDEKSERRPEVGGIEVLGRTQSVPQRKALIAPAAPPHPVTEVLVALGDRVKKGQPLVKIDDDEAQADLRAKQAILEGAIVVLGEARCRLEAIEKGHEKGAVAEEHYHDIRTASFKAEKDVQAAKAALDGAKAELEHFVVEAPIDGVVNRLDVYRGAVSRPGTAVWGEILDLSEIDVRCDLTPEQVDELAVGQTAEMRTNSKKSFSGKGRVVFIGLATDLATGLVPVLVRTPNPDGRLRCGIAVQVRFPPSSR
ncbi:MAG TPA: efflux RND transporter periplasmic adaptor subunit [Gemmataceae bacterium]|nr:efflux RND transporter periplasmic adaptor subunit [Gemmataceae bacterium]